jgi:threonine aldolase
VPLLSRRSFVKSGAACAALGLGAAAPRRALARDDAPHKDRVHFAGDGLPLPPPEYARLLTRLADQRGAAADVYMAGGVVEELEARFAKDLGKEAAAFVPTGTLANHLAIRCQAGGATRALVQAESHIYCDSNDSVQLLSGLNLVPLAPGKATVTLAEVEEACRRAANGPFPLRVGVISLESPVRRMMGEAFDLDEMRRISQFARAHDVRLHLDGARLYLQSAFTGVSPAEYAALFDTVYVSLYKYFNAAFGAVLAGPKKVVQEVGKLRKVFGAGILHGWPAAAVALHYFDGFAERMRKAAAVASELFAELARRPGFRVEPVPHGTNIVRLHVADVDVAKYRANLEEAGVVVRGGGQGRPLLLFVNESAGRRPAAELVRAFVDGLPAK